MFAKNLEQTIDIKIDQLVLKGDLYLPKESQKMVIFAHGSGSSRLSPRNRYVAQKLNEKGIATLLFDLLTAEEEVIDEVTREYRFNIPLLAERLIAVTDWVVAKTKSQKFAIGYFGASTGAAAALIAAAMRPKDVKAVVSRGGRPDLAEKYLSQVKASTLLIVGGWDDVVIKLNQQAQAQLTAENNLEIIPEATHLFEEPGKLDEVIKLACNWFEHYVVL